MIRTAWDKSPHRLEGYFVKPLVKLARKMWFNPTDAEIVLYQTCRSLGLKARRQRIVGRYIVDVYIPELCIAVEADGRRHYTDSGKRRDIARDKRIGQGAAKVQVLRFENKAIINDPNFRALLKAELMRMGGLAEWPWSAK